MKNLLLFVLGCLPVLVWGQFGENIITSDLEKIFFSHITDLDDDGDFDIILSQLLGIKFFINDGYGNFSDAIDLDIIDYDIHQHRLISSGDLDGDNMTDIVIHHNHGNLEWYKNNGNLSFSAGNAISTPSNQITFLEVCDIDNDQILDIVFRVSEGVFWYKNDGMGGFSVPNPISQVPHSSSSGFPIKVCDFDFDGDLDVVTFFTINDVSTFGWAENDGTGNFYSPVVLVEDFASYGTLSVADFDNDGDMDMTIAIKGEGFGGTLTMLRNDGNYQFSQIPITYIERLTLHYILPTDLDLDGDLDIFLGSSSFVTANMMYIENYGDGLFSDKNLISNTKGSQAVVSDFNGDTYPDVFFVKSDIELPNTIGWVENFFGKASIFGKSFHDLNENGLFDTEDYVLKNISFEVTPDILSSYSDKNGNFRFFLEDNTYTITPHPNDCWQLTTDSSSYTVTIDGNTATELNFGFQLASDYQYTQARINSHPTRCGFAVPFILSVENDGCVPSQGQYGIVLDDLVTLISTEIEPDEVRGDTLLWNYAELIASQNDRVHLTLEIAGADFIGDSIQLTGLSYIENEQGVLELSSTYDFSSEIRCAYDPNDKLVYPNRAGEYDANYTLFEEQLEYTVRFQNTGNDTAFTVIIRDYLDTNLDWTTFKPVLASHTHETLLHADGLVEFTFRDILLPDSTTNEPLSHGFVTYRISPKADLEEGTTIENTANIFFDFNPPIETNTTENVLVSELPKLTSTKQVSRQEQFKIYPNPTSGILYLDVSSSTVFDMQILDARGAVLRQQQQLNTGASIDVRDLANGIYTIQLQFEDTIRYQRFVKQ